MDSSRKSSSNKISDIVRLQRMLKKWKKLAKNGGGGRSSTTPAGAVAIVTGSDITSSAVNAISSGTTTTTTSKSIKFLKRTFSFTDVISASSPSSNADVVAVPKGFLAVCVGKELKRFIIPTAYLRHRAFGILLQEAEEEFGFQQEGVLKIPCQVTAFEKILKAVEEKRDVFFVHDIDDDNYADKNDDDAAVVTGGCCSSSSDCDQLPPSPPPQSHHHHAQMCR